MTRQSFRRDERGVTAVEFALTFPLFIGFVLGVIQIGLLLWCQLGLQNAVETAARCAVVDTSLCADASTTESYAAQNAFGLNVPASSFVATTQACGQQASGSGQRVTATYNYAIFAQSFPSTTVTLTAQACVPD
jgi:Flp pilus assembly protein TadG